MKLRLNSSFVMVYGAWDVVKKLGSKTCNGIISNLNMCLKHVTKNLTTAMRTEHYSVSGVM